MMNKKLILHVGCEKTGTTTIQKALYNSSSRLAEAGIIFPKSLGYINHTKIIAAAQDDDVLDNIRAHIFANTGMSLKRFRIDLKRKLQQELNNHEPWHTLIVSTELIHSRIVNKNEVKRLFEIFENNVSNIEIIVFLRRQDELALSRFSTALMAGHKNFDDVFGNIGGHAYLKLPKGRVVKDYMDYYDYKSLIQRFEAFVPRNNIKIALYSDLLHSGNSVEKFITLAGLDSNLVSTNIDNLNTAISVEAQYVISKLNQKIRKNFVSGIRNDNYTKLQKQIAAELTGKKREVKRIDAESFMNMFLDSNEWVRRNYFPERKQLFELDFQKYPKDIDYSHLPSLLDEYVRYYFDKSYSFKEIEGFLSRLKRLLKCTKHNIQAINRGVIN